MAIGFPRQPLALDGAGLEVLDRDECLRLLATATMGRVALSVRALPVILPVRFVLDGDRILVRTHPGSTLATATRDSVVAFEADSATTDESGWSVLVTGVARHLDDPNEGGSDPARLLRPWSATLPDRFIAISTEHMSGRRLCAPTNGVDH
jgi:hypothetical protein